MAAKSPRSQASGAVSSNRMSLENCSGVLLNTTLLEYDSFISEPTVTYESSRGFLLERASFIFLLRFGQSFDELRQRF